ncbi:uncharacterized protein ISCGN_017286 [Ixodes scapularis]
MSSVGAVIAAQPGRGDRHDASTSDYQILLPPLPTGAAVLNTVFLHADIRGRPYRVEDFRDALGHLELLTGVLALGAFQMNHVWAVTFKSPEGKRKTLAAGELVVKGRRCIVVDPGNRDIRVKLHWLLYHVPDDEVKAALASYGTVTEMGTEKWRVQGVMDCGSMTRTAVIRLNPGLGLDTLPHQLRIAGGQVLVHSACAASGPAISAATAGCRNASPAIGLVTTPPTASRPTLRQRAPELVRPTLTTS